MKEIGMDDLLIMFDAHDQLLAMAKTATYIVVFENLDLCSSHLGECSAVAVGPECTYKDIGAVEGKHLYDLPSMRQYPTRFVTLSREETK